MKAHPRPERTRRQLFARGLIPLTLFVLWPAAASVRAQTNSEFSIQINDGLDQPVPGVTVNVFRIQKSANGEEHKIELGRAQSDSSGLARGVYDKSSIPTNESFSVALSKNGYAGYASGPGVNYTLKRQFRAADVSRVLQLPTYQLRGELRELLAGQMDPAGPPLNELIFVQENKARPALRWLLDDSHVGAQAGELLAFLAYPEDIRLLVQYAPTPNGDPAIDHWTYAVASALLNPAGDRDWLFLKRCACDNYGDRWVDTAGIRTLRLIASPRSLQILQDVAKLNPYRSNEVDQAISYINSHPPPLTGHTPVETGEKLAQAMGAGAWMGNEQPRFDDQRDAALIDCDFLINGSQFLVFTATLHQDGSAWRVNGVRQTRQKLLPQGPRAQTK